VDKEVEFVEKSLKIGENCGKTAGFCGEPMGEKPG
jgi:hypothetical protein